MRSFQLRPHLARLGNIVRSIVNNAFPFHTAAWKTAFGTINELVNAPTEDEQVRLTQQWKRDMLSQLHNMEIIVSSNNSPKTLLNSFL